MIYKEKKIPGFSIQKLRDFLWYYPFTLFRLYKKLKKVRLALVFIVVAVVMALIYKQVYGAIVQGKFMDNTLYLGIVDNTNTYNPLSTNPIAKTINKLVFNTLFTVNNQNIPTPSLVSTWSANATNTVVTMSLKKGIMWQDTTDLTAQDVVYSFNLQKKLNPKGPLADLTIKELSPLSIEIDSSSVNSDIWESLQWPILPAHTVYSSYEEIGTGPYILTKNDTSGYYLLANPLYFNGAPKIKNIVVQVFHDQDALYRAYTNGSINAYELVDPEKTITDNLLNDRIDNIFTQPLVSTYNALFFNMNTMKDINIRQGISYAVNDPAIITLLSHYATALNGPINPSSWAYSTNASIQRYPYSDSNALQKFSASGYSLINGKLVNKSNTQLSINIAYDNSPQQSYIVHLIAQQLEKIGINVTLTGYDHAAWGKDILEKKDFEIGYIQVQGTIDPDPTSLWYSGTQTNLSSYQNDNVDRYLDLARNSINTSERQTAYLYFQEVLMNDDPAVFLYSPSVVLEAKPNLKGMSIPVNIGFDTDTLNSIQNWYFTD